jgi:hypothetical protein
MKKYREEYFNWESVEKPLKAISSYKVEDLVLLCQKLGLADKGVDLSKKKKKDLYELAIMTL